MTFSELAESSAAPEYVSFQFDRRDRCPVAGGVPLSAGDRCAVGGDILDRRREQLSRRRADHDQADVRRDQQNRGGDRQHGRSDLAAPFGGQVR
ncbi:hypothetical protein OHA72_36865 [Dactylosporangium sp. NBC_01737]|uniref:hypothetical protein n=1 Tax=Dactylosporangium sp. NBC_01737 TaxID=2975959 RepID=UPI002E153603|nr:hypothetical protein OHA72_36865 [Dactylosporangium sp. NBC_01737]